MKNDMKLIMESWRNSSLISEADVYDNSYTSQLLMSQFVSATANVSKITPKIRAFVLKTLSKYEDFKSTPFWGKFTGFMSKAAVGTIIGFLTAAALASAGIVSPEQAASATGLIAALSASIPQGILNGLLGQIGAEVDSATDELFVKIFAGMQERGTTPTTALGHVVDLGDETEELIKGGSLENNKSPLYLNFLKDLFSKWNDAIDKYNLDIKNNVDTAAKTVADYGITLSAQNFAIDTTRTAIGASVLQVK